MDVMNYTIPRFIEFIYLMVNMMKYVNWFVIKTFRSCSGNIYMYRKNVRRDATSVHPPPWKTRAPIRQWIRVTMCYLGYKVKPMYGSLYKQVMAINRFDFNRNGTDGLNFSGTYVQEMLYILEYLISLSWNIPTSCSLSCYVHRPRYLLL